MISFEEAKQIALDKIRPDCALIDDATMEKSYGWYFRYQSKAYIQSGDFRDMLIGSGGFLVERDDGYVFEFGSYYPLERNLAAYEAGFKYETYNLTILSVSDIQQAVRLLLSLKMKYVIPEEEHGTVWKIPRGYTEVQIRSALASLPYTFSDQKFYFQFEVFMLMNKAGCCKYQLLGYRTGKTAILVHQEMG